MLRIRLTFFSGLVFVGLLIGSSVSAQSTSGPETVLFPFDDYALPFNKGLLLNLIPGRKTKADRGGGSDPEHPGKPVLLPGDPGAPDHPRLYYYGTVLHINGEYRMWYTGYDRNGKRLVCYAVSEDGVKWTKPNLGLVQYNGNTNNNLPTIDGTSVPGVVSLVLYEPDDPNPDRRYKMIREIHPRLIKAAYSPDGLHWTESSNNPIIRGSGLEPSGLIRFQGVYYLNGQAGPIPHPIKGGRKRMMVTYASYDFDHWTQAAHLSFRRDNFPPRPPTDFEVHQGEQVHVGASLWDRGNVVIGIYGQYHNRTNDRRFATVDLGLVVSHDAVHFREPIPDFKMIPYAEESDDAEPRLLQGQGFENIGDRTFIWYSVWPAWHLVRDADHIQPYGPNGIRMATWPRDRLGYFSPGANERNAHCISSPVTTQGPGRQVFINADGLSDSSRLRVEILNERFEPMPGYSGGDCIPVVRSALRQQVAWRGRQSLEDIDHPIRIRVEWEGPDNENARLFAVYVGNSN